MDQAWFEGLPDASRLWVVLLAMPIRPEHRLGFDAELEGMLSSWRHKGQSYQAQSLLLEDQVLLIAEPLLAESPSGCAIDGMLRKLGRLLEEIRVRPLGDHEVLLRVDGKLEAHDRSELLPLFEHRRISCRTPMLDRSLQDLAQLRAGRLERPLAETWVGRKHGLSLLQE